MVQHMTSKILMQQFTGMWLRTDPYVAYKASKSGVVAFTEQLACAFVLESAALVGASL